jgi:hypothetical protein
VYDDDNENATLDGGEAGLESVALTLYADVNADGVLDANDTVIASTTSAADGTYSFLHVCIQNTIVAVTVPSDTGDFTYTLTTAGTQAIDSINTDVTGVDFGINEVQVIDFNVSGTVFDDDNANGASDAGEGTLSGVTVTLYADNNADGALDTGDAVISTATTDANEAYSFANVTSPNVLTVVTVPADNGTFTYVLTTADTQAASSTTADVTGLDFGINEELVIDYTISGNVYDDNDESGAQDAGEENLESITVTLYADNNDDGLLDAGDTVIASATTAVDGTYSFPGVTVQNTVVAVTVPGNTPEFTYTLTTPGSLDTSSTNVNVDNINFGINEVLVIDYGVSGTVFDDDNANGASDAGEGTLSGVTVTLYADNDADGAFGAGDTVIAAVNTDANGAYSFTNITTPNVLTVVTVPGNTPEFTYALTTADTQATSSTIADVTGLDFGINEELVIDFGVSGTVFDDDNANGASDAGEGTLSGVTVTLYADNNADGLFDGGDTVISSTTTDANGAYSFANITTPDVLTVVTVPGNTPEFTYALTTADTQAASSTIADVTGLDFGINEVLVIDFGVSGTVFDDDNANGASDAGEGTLSGVTVTLYADNNADGLFDGGDTVISSTTTDANGAYSFANITTPNVLTVVTVPGNTPEFTYALTTADTQAASSTIADVTGLDFGINEELVIDFGVSGTVFDDDNANGASDAGEGTLSGVTVTLYADNNADGAFDGGDTVISSTTTDANGAYSFANITTPDVLTVVTVPADTATFSYVLTTADTQAASSTIADVTGLDFGINEELIIDYTISGNVYDDNDESGAQDAGEENLESITVTLYADNNANGLVDAGDTVIASATTAVDGTYSFAGVSVQNTVVEVTVPGNTPEFTYTLTTPGAIDTSSTNVNVDNVNFGINEVRVINYNISGIVFDDDNDNAANDAGEGRVENVTITLYADNDGNGRVGAADTIITTTTTAADGSFSFSNVTVENTVTAVTVPTDTGAFVYTLTTSSSANTSSTITDVTGIEFGINEEEVILYNITGNVFDDDDENGVRDTGESFLGAVVITLYADVDGNGRLGPADTVISTTTSSTMSGNYSFNGVTVRDVLVVVTQPADTADFTYTVTTARTQAVSSVNSNVRNVNFGINEVAIVNYNIFGTVYDDDNENGVIDASETGRLANVTLTLYVDDDADGRVGSGDTIIATTTSAADGTYSFLNVTIQNTLVAITVPQNDGSFNYKLTTAARLETSSISTDRTDIDFGVNQVSATFTVSGNVFNDENGDGTNAVSEAGLRNVTVNLYNDVNGNGRIDRGEPLISTTLSDRNGNYQFANITETNVIVQVIVPSNTAQFTYVSTTPVNVPLVVAGSVTVDFGIQRTVVILYNISGVVWDDQNEDQIKDTTEGRLEGIGMTLFEDVNANGILDVSDRSLSTITTSVTGQYQFTNVTLRNVLVVPTLPSNGTFTTPDNRAITSVNTDAIDIDFGIKIASSLFQVTGVVFNDENENGILDAGEESIDGLPVEIYADTDGSGTYDPNLDALVAFTQTSNAGFGFLDPNYLVDDIPPGQVFIVVILPEDTIFETYTPTFDPDSGTAAPDGIFPTFMTGDLQNINFGVKITNSNSTSRASNPSDTGMFVNGTSEASVNQSVEDVSDRLRLYPNPTVREIAINADEFGGDVTVEIYNDRGYRVLSTTVSPFGGEVKVNVQRLAPGMYYAKFGSINKVASKKFVKR